MRLFILFLFFLGFDSGLHAIAGTIDPNTPDSKYVAFGTQFPSVVRLKAKIKCENPECTAKEHTAYGSAVVIKPHWILTAAHVVEGSHGQTAVTDKGTEHVLQHLVVHKEFQSEQIGFHDLALGYTPDPIALDFYPEIYTEFDEVGKAITIAGYGITGTFHTGGKISDGKKRGGHNVIESTSRAALVCNASVGSKRLPLEFLITPGDSGGGMFIGNKLAGINSFLMADDKNPDGTYGDEAAFTRLSLYAPWVQRQIAKHELALQALSTTGADLTFPDAEVRQ